MQNRSIWALAEVVGEAAAGTGVLRVSAADGQRAIFFEEGVAVYFVSDCSEDSLLGFLERSRQFESDEARLHALASRVSRSRPLVSLVLEDGLCDSARLAGLLVEHMFECVARLFEGGDAVARFLPHVRARHPLSFAVAPRRLLVEAARRVRDGEVVRSALGPLTWMAVPAPDHTERLERAPVGYAEGALGAILTEETSIADLVSLSGLPEEDALRALLALRLAGVLDPFEAPKDLTETGRLRRRLEAQEEGVVVDMEAAAVALNAFAEPVESSHVAPAVAHALVAVPERKPDERERAVTAPPAKEVSGKLRMMASVYVQLARTEAEKGNVSGAVAYFKTALAQHPNDLRTLMAFAEFMRSRPNGDAVAEDLLKQACVTHPRSVTARLTLANLYRETGNGSGADELLAEVGRLDPGRVRKARGAGGLVDRVRGFAGLGRGHRERS